MKGYAVMIAFFGSALYTLTNAIYALCSPAKYLRSVWTPKRGLSADTPTVEVRAIGFIFLVMGALLAFESIRLLRSIVL